MASFSSSSPFSSPSASAPASPPPAYLPSSSSSRRTSSTSSLERHADPHPTTFNYSPSSRSLTLTLSGPTPTPSRPLSFIESEAPTRVGSPAPSVKEKEGKQVDEEKGEEEGEKVEEEEEAYPEGGLRAWLAVAGSTMVLMVTFGFSNSYGAFLPYYHAHQISTYTTSQISWIGSAHLFITFSCAFGAGVLFDRGWFQWQLAIGSLGWLVGIFCLSLARTFWQIFLAQAVCMGLSLGLMFSPCLSVLGTYFKRRRAFVVGIAASGTAIGAVVFPVLLSREFERKGFGEGVRSAGYLMLSLLLLANFLLRPRRLSPSPSSPSSPLPLPKPPLSQTLRSIVSDRASWLVNLGVFCIYTCCFIPLFFVTLFAKQYVGGGSVLATYSLSIINTTAFFSRILSGLLADRLGVFNLALPLALSVGALTFGMIGCTSSAPLLVFLVLFGVAQGGWISVSATCFMMLARDASEIGLRSGIGFFFVALAVLIGSPIAGALLQATGGSYVAALCFGGGLALVGVGLLALGRREVVRRKGTMWV